MYWKEEMKVKIQLICKNKKCSGRKKKPKFIKKTYTESFIDQEEKRLRDKKENNVELGVSCFYCQERAKEIMLNEAGDRMIFFREENKAIYFPETEGEWK